MNDTRCTNVRDLWDWGRTFTPHRGALDTIDIGLRALVKPPLLLFCSYPLPCRWVWLARRRAPEERVHAARHVIVIVEVGDRQPIRVCASTRVAADDRPGSLPIGRIAGAHTDTGRGCGPQWRHRVDFVCTRETKQAIRCRNVLLRPAKLVHRQGWRRDPGRIHRRISDGHRVECTPWINRVNRASGQGGCILRLRLGCRDRIGVHRVRGQE